MEAFESFLATTEHRARADELFAMFNRKIDFVKTLTLAAADYVDVMDYMMTSLDEFTIIIPECGDVKWVPVDLLRHIYKQDTAFLKHLHRFMKVAHQCGEAKLLGTQQMLAYQKGNLGKTFLLWVASFILLINKDEDAPEVESLALTIGGPARDSREPAIDAAGPSQETTWGITAYPHGQEQALIASAEQEMITYRFPLKLNLFLSLSKSLSSSAPSS